MRRQSLVSAGLLVGLATGVAAQQPSAAVKPADFAGTWTVTSMVGPKDSVITTFMMTATAGDSGWQFMFSDRTEPVAVRVTARGGDSVVIEAGPFPSVLRPGQTVTLVRTVAHYKGDALWGTFDAQYSSGDKISGKTAAKRGK